MNCMKDLRLHRQRLKGKNSGSNIWIGREDLTAFAGNGFFDDMRQEHVTLL